MSPSNTQLTIFTVGNMNKMCLLVCFIRCMNKLKCQLHVTFSAHRRDKNIKRIWTDEMFRQHRNDCHFKWSKFHVIYYEWYCVICSDISEMLLQHHFEWILIPSEMQQWKTIMLSPCHHVFICYIHLERLWVQWVIFLYKRCDVHVSSALCHWYQFA